MKALFIGLISYATLCVQRTLCEELYSSCPAIPVDKNFNLEWTAPIKFWYTPLWTRGDIYKTSEPFFSTEEFSELTNADLNKICFYYELKQNVRLYGFGDRMYTREVYANVARPATFEWTTSPDSKNNTEYWATSYVTLSDYESAFVLLTIWEDGTRGVCVSSKNPTISQEFKERAEKHIIEDLGFNRNDLVYTPYDNCSKFNP